MVQIYLYADYVGLQMNCPSLTYCLEVTGVLDLPCGTGSLHVIFVLFSDFEEAVLFMVF